MIFTLLAGLIVAYVIWTWICLERNVRLASRMGIPAVRLPIDSHNVLWQIFEANLWNIIDALPIPWLSYPESIRFMRRGWHFFEKAQAHERHGPIWALVSGASINVHVSSPDAVRDVLMQHRDFVRLVKNYKILNVFGPNISSADTANWPRHRKALAEPFSENTMKFVWDEAIRQTTSMTKVWFWPNVQTDGIASVQADMRCVSLNVLAASGFRKSYEFQDPLAVQDETSYRATLQTILDNAIPLMLIPYKVLMAPIVPKSWRKIGQAGDSFRRYMEGMVEEETNAFKQGKPGAGGIMTSLVKARNVSEKASSTESSLAKGLSIEEIFGNLFVINFAGHDTTANTLTFAMLLLSREPKIQDWVAEEIASATAHMEKLEDWTYDRLFERLLRCRAVLYETLRLFPPVMAVPRGTDSRPQSLNVNGRSITILPDVGVTVSVLACHTDSSVWPDEPLEWKPSRWITEQGTFYEPPPWTFLPWSEGPQKCPGKKFAEVEFVAVLAIVLKENRLKVKVREDESLAEAEKRVLGTIHDVNMEMLLRMKDADSVRLQYYGSS